MPGTSGTKVKGTPHASVPQKCWLPYSRAVAIANHRARLATTVASTKRTTATTRMGNPRLPRRGHPKSRVSSGTASQREPGRPDGGRRVKTLQPSSGTALDRPVKKISAISHRSQETPSGYPLGGQPWVPMTFEPFRKGRLLLLARPKTREGRR
jgi:hypothetical protein